MALARILSRGQRGMDAYPVVVEVHLAGGLPSFTISGLPAAAVRESKDRVRAALQTCGVPVAPSRITAHLGPADIPKEGGRFDLPIALGVMLAQGSPAWPSEKYEFIGELALSGELRPVRGALPAVLAARDAGHRLVLPAANAAEASLVEDARVYAAEHLLQVVEHLEGVQALPKLPPMPPERTWSHEIDLSDVRGHGLAKRALTIAAAGGHHLLMVGPPGSGKSMLAQRFVTLLPRLTSADILHAASIASVAGESFAAICRGKPPFRAPHHTASPAALVGGGSPPKPGEISLAHSGVLFLDELPEFPRRALEAMREPLENGTVSIVRSQDRAEFPCDFQLIAAMNPCPCGFFGDGTERCSCSESRIAHYRARLSGPLLDRFDIHVEVPRIPFEDLTGIPCGGESVDYAEAARQARSHQIERSGVPNARLTNRELWKVAILSPSARRLLLQASDRWRLSNRSCTRILKVARSIADLACVGVLTAEHVAEALQLRCLDRSF